MNEITEKDLNIGDVWEAPNGNVFIKVSNNYSIAIGNFGREPIEDELKNSQYVKSNDFVNVKKIGHFIKKEKDEK